MHPTLKKNPLQTLLPMAIFLDPYCFHTQGFSNSLNVSREVAALTTENLTPTDVSAATFIVEQLTQEAVHNSQVVLNCMLHVSGIMLYNTHTLFI